MTAFPPPHASVYYGHMPFRAGTLIHVFALGVLAAGITACAGSRFHAVEHPPGPVIFELGPATVQEYWSGIVFNGEKIGFSHFRLCPAPDDPGRYDIETEAVFFLKVLMVEKRFSLRAHDRVHADLTLARFSSDYDLDGSVMHITGRVEGDSLKTEVHVSGETTEQTFALASPVLPSSVLYLYPAVHGLKVGRAFEYPVYNGETRRVSMVRQEVIACEESDLFDGRGFRVKTVMHGQKVTAWLDGQGRPLLEQGRAECQGHALLFTALARAAGVPTRVVSGIVYSADHRGFLYHTWVECCIGEAWVSVDPVFGQERSDATHLKIVEGESPEDLLPLAGLIGRVRAEIITSR